MTKEIENDIAKLRAEVNALMTLLPESLGKLIKPVLARLISVLEKIAAEL